MDEVDETRPIVADGWMLTWIWSEDSLCIRRARSKRSLCQSQCDTNILQRDKQLVVEERRNNYGPRDNARQCRRDHGSKLNEIGRARNARARTCAKLPAFAGPRAERSPIWWATALPKSS